MHARLHFAIRHGWRVQPDPSRGMFGRFVCGNTSLTWPDCVVGFGDTEMEALDDAIAKTEKTR